MKIKRQEIKITIQLLGFKKIEVNKNKNNEIEENKRKFKDFDFYIIESFVVFFLISKNFN